MGNDGIVISDTEPTTVFGKFTWLKILPDGSRKWYERADGGWTLVKSEPVPALANHNHGGIDFDHSGDKLEITRLKIEKGIITALEYEV